MPCRAVDAQPCGHSSVTQVAIKGKGCDQSRASKCDMHQQHVYGSALCGHPSIAAHCLVACPCEARCGRAAWLANAAAQPGFCGRTCQLWVGPGVGLLMAAAGTRPHSRSLPCARGALQRRLWGSPTVVAGPLRPCYTCRDGPLLTVVASAVRDIAGLESLAARPLGLSIATSASGPDPADATLPCMGGCLTGMPEKRSCCRLLWLLTQKKTNRPSRARPTTTQATMMPIRAPAGAGSSAGRPALRSRATSHQQMQMACVYTI
jgi:hypothetical protein